MSRIDGIIMDLKESIEDFAHEFKLLSLKQEDLEIRIKQLEEKEEVKA